MAAREHRRRHRRHRHRSVCSTCWVMEQNILCLRVSVCLVGRYWYEMWTCERQSENRKTGSRVCIGDAVIVCMRSVGRRRRQRQCRRHYEICLRKITFGGNFLRRNLFMLLLSPSLSSSSTSLSLLVLVTVHRLMIRRRLFCSLLVLFIFVFYFSFRTSCYSNLNKTFNTYRSQTDIKIYYFDFFHLSKAESSVTCTYAHNNNNSSKQTNDLTNK